MKRTERISRQASRCAVIAFANLAVSVAAGAWWKCSIAAPIGSLLFAVALVALTAAVRYGRESRRLSQKVAVEQYWDNLRAIRPKL